MTRALPNDWVSLYHEAERHLVNLIRADTANPPGDERIAADYVANELRGAGIVPVVLEMAPGRPNVVARLRGHGDEGGLLFLSHLDVVPAQPDGWTHPPFSGDVVDDVIWGRGALDMKHIVAATLAVAIRARQLAIHLDRDLVFAATADEESAGQSGAGWLFEHHPELVACDRAVSEGGDVLEYGGQTIFLIEAAQKGWLTVDLIRRSPAGHSSIPTTENCLLDIGDTLHRLGERRFPHRATAVARAFVEGLAATQTEPERSALLALLETETFDRGLSALSCDDVIKRRFEAILHSHATPTMITGGESVWAIPGEVRLTIAGRVLPDETLHDWLRALQTVIGPLGEHELSSFDAGQEASADTDFFRTLAEIVESEHEEATVLPTVLPGGGDLRHARAAGAAAYGFFPLQLEQGESIWNLAHGRDERISRDNLRRCVRYAWQVLARSNKAR